MNLNLLEEAVLEKIEQGQLNIALEMVQKFVECVLDDPYATATVFGSKRLDSLCLAIGQALGSEKELSALPEEAPEKSGKYVVTIATDFAGYGGHTLVAEDAIRAQPGKIHIALVTDLFNRADINYLAGRFHTIAELRLAPRGNAKKKLEWLAKQLADIKPSRIFLFNHHQDAVAIAGIQPWLEATKIFFYHHADHNLCLGVHLPQAIHIDPHNVGYHNCKVNEHLEGNFYLPLVVEDRGPRPATLGFIQHGHLRTCSSGTSNKFDLTYKYSYLELIAKRLKLRNGVHFHIGNIPEGMLESIRKQLAAEGIDSDRFIHIPWVKSLWAALIENNIDLYISSFPLGGGRASIEAMGSGTPLLMHQNGVSRFFGGADLAYPEAKIWRGPEEFYECIRSLTPQMLVEHSGYARAHYESFHLPSLMAAELDNMCEGKITLKPPPLKPYEPDHLERYLHYRALGIDKHQGLTTGLNRPVRYKQLVLATEQSSNPLSPTGHVSVSAMVMCYQQKDIVQRTLESLLNQDYPIDEIIVSDDCSSDGTFQAVLALEPLLRKRCNNLVIRQNPKNQGIVAHFNILFELSRNEFMVCFAGDDISEPQRIRRLAETYRNAGCPRYCLIHSDVRMIDEKDNLGDIFKPPVITDHLDLMETALSGRLHIGATAAFTRALWADYGGFEEPWIYEDLILGWRATMHGQYHYLPECLLRYRVGGVSFQPASPEKNQRHALSLYRQRLLDTQLAESAGLRTDLGDIRCRLQAILNTLETEPNIKDSQTNINTQFDLTKNYKIWQSHRSIITEEIQVLEKQILQTSPFDFYLCMRMAPGQETALADTLDSLSGQFYPHWHLDIVTELPAPEGLDDIPCIGWHTAKTEEHKHIIDEQIELHKSDWCVEIPAGARLDPLYLWRLSSEAIENPDIRCFFVDDDCFDSSSRTFDPRFKPGCNPSALESSDLAGPICITRETWNSIGGASESNASPWFHQLLRISRNHGWGAIKHIPDVLISYPEIFPSDVQNCMFSLLEHLDYNNKKTEIIPTTAISWGFRYRLTNPPKISIAILSKGRLELLTRCVDSIVRKTLYPSDCLEVFIIFNQDDEDPDVTSWLNNTTNNYNLPITAIRTPSRANKATRSNAAVQSASGEFTALLDEELIITEAGWLTDLVGTCSQPGIAGTTPCLIRPEANTIHHAGLVLGIEGIAIPLTGSQTGRTLETNIAMKGVAGPLYEKMAMHDNTGYLGSIKMPRDVSVISSLCMLVRTHAYREAGGMDEGAFGDTLADIDLSLKMRQKGWRLIYQPLATVGFGDVTDIEIPAKEAEQAQEALNQANARESFKQRWWPKAAVDPLWSPNLSLSSPNPTPEINYLAPWQYLPLGTPKILAYPVDGGQGIIRINQPVEALRKAGLAQVFLRPQKPTASPISPAELLRLAPDSVILHHFFNNTRLPELQSWHSVPGRPFMVFAMDDLVTALDETNPFKKNIPPDGRSRLKKALAHCDRLVVSTDYLGNTCTNLISDIRVVPNFIEQGVWLPLRSQRRTTPKPRIGWAGGTTHQGDLALLKEIIEQTREEADWIFFGMCPDEIKPLLAEYHTLVTIDQYPSYLASLNLDIAVAPLAQTPFNRAKSNLRLLEYGILGIPVVCTDIDPYQNSPACCVPNTPTAWTNALRERIYDADAREQEGRAMREWVIKNHLLENNLETWLSAHLPC